MHRAIETNYKGYRFRSRLEARWAVFFDAMRIEWMYEPEGFESTTADGGGVRYLPDFYLPQSGTWVEVKGKWTLDDAKKILNILDFDSPLWNFIDSGYKLNYEAIDIIGLKHDGRGLLLLSDIPKINYGRVFFPMLQHKKGVVLSYAELEGYVSRAPIDAVDLARQINGFTYFDPCLDKFSSSDQDVLEVFQAQAIAVECKLARPELRNALNKARSARFEHGEAVFP
jgi:hypothetical protein